MQIVENSTRGASQVSFGPDSTILKTMQKQIIVSNELLSGLVDNDQRSHSQKRQMSCSDSDDVNLAIADP